MSSQALGYAAAPTHAYPVSSPPTAPRSATPFDRIAAAIEHAEIMADRADSLRQRLLGPRGELAANAELGNVRAGGVFGDLEQMAQRLDRACTTIRDSFDAIQAQLP